MKRQAGMSLVSLLIGAAIGGFLILAIMQIFTTSRQINKMSTNLTKLNEESRFLPYYMNKIIGQYAEVGETAELGNISLSNISENAISVTYTQGSGCNGTSTSNGTNVVTWDPDNKVITCATNGGSAEELLKGTLDALEFYAQISDDRQESFVIKSLKDVSAEERTSVVAIKGYAIIRTVDAVKTANSTQSFDMPSGSTSYTDRLIRRLVKFTVPLPYTIASIDSHIYEPLGNYTYGTGAVSTYTLPSR